MLSSPRNTRRNVLVALLIATATYVWIWRDPSGATGPDAPAVLSALPLPATPIDPQLPGDSVTTAPTGASGPVQNARVDVAPQEEQATLMAAAGLASSFGRRAGLHKVKDDLNLSASAALVIDQQSGAVLFRKNAEAVLPIASLTKLMTALVVTEAKLPMDEVITISEDDVDGERHSRSRLRVGTSLSRGEALHLALMSSENRASHALGRSDPRGLTNFVQAMNRKAKALGMANTVFVDPTGLSNRNRSTAHDLSLLTAAASLNPLMSEYSTTPQHELAASTGRVLRYNNSNRLIKNPQWDISLQKTGYIVEAGWCLVMSTKIAGHDLLVVLLDAGGKSSRIADAERIRRWVASQMKVAAGDRADTRRQNPI